MSRARAADQIVEATITVTNFSGIATNGTDTLVVNAETRTGTNNVAANPAIYFLGTNSMLHGKTNLYNHIALYPFGAGATRLTLINIGTNSFKLRGQLNQAITATIGGVWGTASLATNTVTNFTGVTVPLEFYTAAEATNVAYELTRFFSYASNAVAAAASGLTNHLNQFLHQTASNKLFYASTNRSGALESAGRISGTNVALTNLTLVYIQAANGTNVQLTNVVIHHVVLSGVTNISGFVSALTNGTLWSNVIAQSRFTNGNYHGETHVLSNGVYYSPDLRSPITTNLTVWGNLQIGDSASGIFNSWAIQTSGTTNFQIYSTEMGELPFQIWSSGNAVKFWSGAGQSGAIPPGIVRVWTNWGAFYSSGIFSLASTSAVATVQSNLIATNILFGGTNIFGGDASFPRSTVTTVANGHNTINIGTNVYVDLTGSPTAAWTWGGLTGGNRDGKMVLVVNNTGWAADILHNSGTEPTAALRITTPTGTNITLNNAGAAWFIYNPSSSRWILLNVFNTATPAASATNALSSLSTNGVQVTSALTNLNLIIRSNVVITVTNTSGNVDIQISATSMSTNGAIPLFINNAKPALTNMPSFDGNYLADELLFPRTNAAGTDIALSANWSFALPTDYATNTATLRIIHSITATNGPNASNVVWRASFLHSENGSTTDLRVGSFGTAYLVTNSWAACYNCTNQAAISTIAFTNASALSPGGLGILKLERVSTVDTYVGAASLIGLQIDYGK